MNGGTADKVTWVWQGRTGRVTYLVWGLLLMLLKYSVDRTVVWAVVRTKWTWQDYWSFPFFSGETNEYTIALPNLLLLVAVPFMLVGIVLTVRRLRDASWPLWLTILFFMPIINIGLFLLLSLAPPRTSVASSKPIVDTWWHRLSLRLALGNPVASATVAILLSVQLLVPLLWFAVNFLRTYGWGVFVALPFFMGMSAAVLHGLAARRSWKACAGVATLALFLSGLTLIAMALEGAVCVLMAAPIAFPIVILGATVGYFLQAGQWERTLQGTRIYAAAWIILPLALATENWRKPELPLVAAVTSVEIDAPSTVVWEHVVTFSEIPAPSELIFRAGIAYPVRARIEGRGVGAIRHCEFSTGAFVEPITAWDAPHRLAFDVTEQPDPMRELSPYGHIDAPHLDDFFRSHRGQFLLTTLPNNRTRLEGTTWYTQDIWPATYWRLWSDYLVHRIHARVLDHIKAESEAAIGNANAKR